MRAGAKRMEAAVALVATNPGLSARELALRLLESPEPGGAGSPKADALETRRYKQASAIVERVIKDRHVRLDDALRLHPWDPKLRAYAEALERARNAAPDDEQRVAMTELAAAAWIAAGDANRARILRRLA